jgi:hypothetical protein
MSRPGVEVSSAASAPPRGVPTDTSVTFICAEAQMGPVDAPTRLTSLDQFTATYGQRVAGTYGYDSLDAALHEGTATAYFMRLVDEALAAKVSAAPIVAAPAEVVAANPGVWGNGLVLKVALTPVALAAQAAPKASKTSTKPKDGASADEPPEPEGEPEERKLGALTFAPEPRASEAMEATVTLNGTVVQSSLALANVEALVNFLASGPYLRLVKAASLTAAVLAGTVKPVGGTDGTVPVDEIGTVETGLTALTADLGPGQLLLPGRADAESQAAALAHCAGTSDAGVNRVALLDGAIGDDATTLETRAKTLRGALEDRYGSLWAPWATIPGLAPGTSRTIPWSAIQAGICARNDAAGNPNQAGAGPWGVSRYADSLTVAFTDAQRESLLLAGVDTARSVYGTIESYAFRTLVDPNGPRASWRELNHARLNMAIVARAEAVGEQIVFTQIDGRGLALAKFNGLLAAMLKEFYDDGAIYGDEPADAFTVNTGPAVNTPATLAEGNLRAVLSVRMSPHAELVQIEIVKVPITVALAA